MGFGGCVKYLALTGAISFIAGRLLPKKWFRPIQFPYKLYRFEQDGRLYEKLRIKSWHRKLPDMSCLFPKLMPPKRFNVHDEYRLPDMIRETCVAELIHRLLCISGLYCIEIWQGSGGKILSVLNILGNIPFVLAQRYNRPRLVRLMKNAEKKGVVYACTDFEL